MTDTRTLTRGQLQRRRDWVLQLAREYPTAEVARALRMTDRQVVSDKHWLAEHGALDSSRGPARTRIWEGEPVDWLHVAPPGSPAGRSSAYAAGPWPKIEGLYNYLITTNAENRAAWDVSDMTEKRDGKAYLAVQLQLDRLIGLLESIREIVQDAGARDDAVTSGRHDRDGLSPIPGVPAPMPPKGAGRLPARSHSVAWAALWAGLSDAQAAQAVLNRGAVKTLEGAQRAVAEVIAADPSLRP